MTRRRLARVRVVAPVVVVALALTACSHSAPPPSGSATPTTAAAPQTLVVLGSTAAVGVPPFDGLRNAWPKLFWRSAFPISTVFVNASSRATSIDEAAALELPLALQMHANTVAIWLAPPGGACTPTATATDFEFELTGLVKPLRTAGARVLVGNISASSPCAVAFNAAITNVARARGAIVVDVAAALASTPAIGPDSGTTFRESHAIAAAFSAAAVAAGR